MWGLGVVKWNAYRINSTSDYEGYWGASVLCRAREKWDERHHKRAVNYIKDELASFNFSPDNEISIWAWGCCFISGVFNKIYSTIIYWVFLNARPWTWGWKYTEEWATVAVLGKIPVCKGKGIEYIVLQTSWRRYDLSQIWRKGKDSPSRNSC